MADLRLNIKQSQTMAMTPQMQQSIKILQMSSLDLQPYLMQAIEENPFLDNPEAATDNYESSHDENAHNENDNREDSWSDDVISPAVYDSEPQIYSKTSSSSHDFSEGGYGVEDLSEQHISLKDYINDQINIDITNPMQRLIAVHLTDMLDDSGYIAADFGSVAQLLKCEISQIEDTLLILQKFDPAGVFARNLAECLAIQLREKDRFDPAMQLLISNLDLLAKCDFTALRKICSVSDEDLKDMIEEIKALNPRPGNGFSTEQIQILQPDIFLKKGEKGKWHLELNSDALPKVLINRRYYSEIDVQVKDKESRKFLSEQYSNANWLMKALDQRANTILKVATDIVLKQDSFFKYGIHYLKPLVLSDIAQAVDMHESTISRVINGKYIATHMGVYELKYFFSSAVSSNMGEGDVSSRRIKFMIKELIEKEEPKAILSDDKIAEMLKEQGIDVARRTVMKYRESMDIPSSVQRRRMKGK